MTSEYEVINYRTKELIGHISMASNWITGAAIKLGIDLELNGQLGIAAFNSIP